MELLEYEKKHINYLKDVSSECTLFLKRNDEFPISDPTTVCLVGNGARRTIKGGTGSGDVASRYFKSIEDGLKSSGFTITSTKWMDDYDEFYKSTISEYIKDGKKEARRNHILANIYTMGFFDYERNYTFDCNYDADICIYVLSRNSGEGNDRRNIKGDVKLSDKEVKDILYLNKKFKKFMLVLNVGGVIDLTPILEVSNILLLSQLGVVTADILSGIILGKYNPSGKLTTTWTKPEEYPYFNEFGDRDETYYKEGIYVGYRYFSTVNKNVFFPFGFGLSYTDFSITLIDSSITDNICSIKTRVRNIGNYEGKEVVQIYVTKPNDKLDNPYLELCGYKKTKNLKPNEAQELTIEIDITKLSSYDEKNNQTLLLSGDYILRLGNSSINLTDACVLTLTKDIILEQHKSMLGSVSFDDYKPNKKIDKSNAKRYILNLDIKTQKHTYKKDEYIDPLINTLPNEDLANVCLGHHVNGLAGIIGSSCKNVIGGAGETVLCIPQITKSLTMADGPAGLRLKTIYGIDNKGVYDITIDPIMEKMLLFLPKIAGVFMKPPKNRHGKIYHQYTTAIPIGTALGQSYNDEMLINIGNLIKEEMEIFNVDLWLAPAINIHRNILCGRNFEYYSEDPYVSARAAIAITKGIESDGRRGVVIKHFAANNQEFNRNNNNSNVSQRALREIYLKCFELVIKETKPKGIMTSYNLINGIHTSMSYELLNDILRCEWEYDGLVMSDWIASGRSFCKKSKHKAPYASNNILAGNDLTMSGCNADYKDIMKALKIKKLSRKDLVISASRVYRAIITQKK